MGWANRITVLRGFLTLGLWALLVLDGPAPSAGTWWIALWAFAAIAVSDLLDGFLARRFGEVSVFGRIADPLVDKMLVLGTMVILLGTAPGRAVLPAWMVAVMLTRELLVTALRGAVEGRGASFQAMPIGKAKMLVQSLAVGGVMVHAAGTPWVHAELPVLSALPAPHHPWCFAHLLVWLATLLTVASGIDYAVRAASALLRA